MSGQVCQLPVWDTLTTAWKKTDGVKGSFWASMGILFVIMFGIGVIEGYNEANPYITTPAALTGNLFAYLVQLGLIYMGICRAKDITFNFKSMFYAFKLELVLRLFGLYIIQLLIFTPSILLGYLSIYFLYRDNPMYMAGGLTSFICIILTTFIAIRLSFCLAFMLDAGAGPTTSIKSSIQATSGNFFNLLALFLLQLAILAISIIAAGIGLIWTIPLTYISYGIAYQHLRHNV